MNFKWGWDGGGRQEGVLRRKQDEEDIRLEAEGHYLYRLCTAIKPFLLSRVQECPLTSLKGQYI